MTLPPTAVELLKLVVVLAAIAVLGTFDVLVHSRRVRKP